MCFCRLIHCFMKSVISTRTMTNVLTAFSCQRTFVIFYLLNSDITGGVVHNYAFSCIHRHIRCRQRKCAWNLDGAHAVVVNAEPLFPYTVDLFCIEHFDFFHQFIQHPGCQLFCSGVLANQTDKHIRCHGTAALLFDFGAELFDFLGQLLLLVLVSPGHSGKAFVRDFAGNIVLIEPFKEHGAPACGAEGSAAEHPPPVRRRPPVPAHNAPPAASKNS